MLPVQIEETLRHGFVMALALVADPVVPGSLSHARGALVTPELGTPPPHRIEARQLLGSERGDLEESRGRAIHHRGQQGAEFILGRSQLPNQRRTIHAEP
jgi:hypothetical protein